MTFFAITNRQYIQRAGLLLALPLTLAIAACSGGSDSNDTNSDVAAADTAQQTDSKPSKASRGKLLYTQCAACHATEADATARVGPNLNCILDRPAGKLADFKYSESFKKAASDGVVFDKETLESFITNSKAVVPGNAMAFGGVSNEDSRDQIVDYLISQCSVNNDG